MSGTKTREISRELLEIIIWSMNTYVVFTLQIISNSIHYQIIISIQICMNSEIYFSPYMTNLSGVLLYEAEEAA